LALSCVRRGVAREGKKKMHRFGKVEIPREAFIAALKADVGSGWNVRNQPAAIQAQ
jgi:hypothetical protein